MILITFLSLLLCCSSASCLDVSLSYATSYAGGGATATMDTQSGSLIRWTNQVVPLSYTQSVVHDAYVPTYFGMAFKKGTTYNIEGETAAGTAFVLRMTVTQAEASYKVIPKYAAPILEKTMSTQKNMAWTSLSNMVKACPELDMTRNTAFQFWNSFREDRTTVDCLSKYDYLCSAPDYATGAACLGKQSDTWWAKPVFDGTARWGNYRANLVDHYWAQGSCGLGGCTPGGVLYSFLQPWDKSGEVNTVFVASLDPNSVEFEFKILIEPLLGLPTMPSCTLTQNVRDCVLDESGTRISINGFQPPVYDTDLAFFMKCTETDCTHIETKRWLLPGTIADPFPAIKWEQFPGPHCGMLPGTTGTAVTFWPEVNYQRFVDSDPHYARGELAQGIYHTSDKGSNDPCGNRYTMVDQTLAEFDERTDELLYCSSADVKMAGYTEFSTAYSDMYSGAKCGGYTSTGCYYTGLNVTMDSCQGGQFELYGIITSDEVVVNPPAGVDVSSCVISTSGYYNSDEGAVLTLRSCATAGPMKLRIDDPDIFFAGGLTSVYATAYDSSQTTLAITVTYSAKQLTLTEVYSGTSTTVILNLLDAEIEFPPDVTDGGNDTLGDGFNFFRTSFGKVFGIILIVCAFCLLFMLLSCAIKTNKAKGMVVNVGEADKKEPKKDHKDEEDKEKSHTFKPKIS